MQWPPNIPTEREMNRLLSQAKMNVFKHKGSGFHGSLLCSHEIIWSDRNNTGWCNGKQIGINPEFFYKLDLDGRVALLVHELRHTAHDHFSRFMEIEARETGNGKTWNIAGDYIINNDMDNLGFRLESFVDAGITPCLDHQYDGETTEGLYYKLLQNTQPMPQLDPMSEDMAGDLDAPSTGDGQPQQGNTGNMSPAQQEAAAQAQKAKHLKILVQAKMASEMAGDQAGTIPGEILTTIDKFLNPKLPWETILYRWYTDLNNDDYSYRRPNRRHEDIILPSLLGDNGLEHLAFFIDASGSITDDEIVMCNSEVRGIHKDISPSNLTLATFDTQIQDVYRFAKDDDFEKITITGRGGTDLDCVHDFIKEEKPTAAVIFTDLYCRPMVDPGIPVVWIISGNPNANPGFGKVIHIDT